MHILLTNDDGVFAPGLRALRKELAKLGDVTIVAPALEEIAGERDDLRIVKLNVDDNQQTAAQYQVLAIPTMILFNGGQPVATKVGAAPKSALQSWLAGQLPQGGQTAQA